MVFHEHIWRDAFGAVVIQSRLGPAIGRQGFEKMLPAGIEVGLSGWERAHSQGQGTGHESPYAIRYAPEEVNQAFQRLGIERYLHDLFEHKPADVQLWLTTTTETHAGTLRLKEIQYRVDAEGRGTSRRLFEASIQIADERIHPRVSVRATPYATI